LTKGKGENDNNNTDVAPAKRNSATVVLGKTQSPNYADVAKENGFRNFSVPTEIWKSWTSDEQLEANMKFLDRAIAKGDKIVLSHNPSNPGIDTGFFKKELNYLKSKGYTVSADGKSMIPPKVN